MLSLHVDRKVFSKLNLHVPEKTVRRIVVNAAGAVEPILHILRDKIQKKIDHAGENTVGQTSGQTLNIVLFHQFFL